MAQNSEKYKNSCTNHNESNQIHVKSLLLLNEENIPALDNKLKEEIAAESLLLSALSSDSGSQQQSSAKNLLEENESSLSASSIQLSSKDVLEGETAISYAKHVDLSFDVTGVELIALQQNEEISSTDCTEVVTSQNENIINTAFSDHQSYVVTTSDIESLQQNNITAVDSLANKIAIVKDATEESNVDTEINFQPMVQSSVTTLIEKMGNENKSFLTTSNFDNSALLSMVNIERFQDSLLDANEGESSKFPVLFTASTANQAHEIIKAYAEETLSTFVSMRKMKRYGITEGGIDLQQKNYRVFFESSDVEYDGIPYIYIADKMYICHLGKDKTEVTRQKIRQQSLERRQKLGLPTKSISTTRVRSKKIDCPVKISVKMIAKFPQFKVHKKSKRICETASKKVRQALVETNGKLSCYYVFVGSLPSTTDHNHGLGEANSEHEPIDPLIKDKIIQLTWEGITSSSDVKKALDEYVEQELFAGKTSPGKSRRRYYPNVKDVRNYMNKAKMLTRLSSDVKVELQQLATKLQQSRPSDNIILYSDVVRDSADHNSMLKATPDEATKPSLIFCHQTPQQQRLMKRYNNLVFMCEITNLVDRVPFPLFCIFVQTNVDYQLVGTFIVEVRNKESIMQGLTSIKEWNPGWAPKYFVLDYSEEQDGAVKALFPGSSQFISERSREQNWHSWLSKVQNKLVGNTDEIFQLFKDIATAYNETKLHKAALQLENSQVWKEYAPLRSWFNSQWLLEAKKWVIGYRPDDFVITLHNDPTYLLQDIKTFLDAHMSFTRGKKLCTLIERLVDRITPDFYRRYTDLNRKSFTQANELEVLYGDHLPTCLMSKPAAVIMHVLEQIKSTESTVYQVSHIQPGIFWVHETADDTSTNQNAHTVSFGDVNNLPSCDCVEWQRYKLPCKHFCSVFSSFPDWGWDMLNTNYIANPLINLDYSCIKPWVDAQDRQVKKLSHFDGTKTFVVNKSKDNLTSLGSQENIETSFVIGDLEIDTTEANMSKNGDKKSSQKTEQTDNTLSNQQKIAIECKTLLQSLSQFSTSNQIESLKTELRNSIDLLNSSEKESASTKVTSLLGKRVATFEDIQTASMKKAKVGFERSDSSIDGSYISDDEEHIGVVVQDDVTEIERNIGVVLQDDVTDIEDESIEFTSQETLSSTQEGITVTIPNLPSSSVTMSPCNQTQISLLNAITIPISVLPGPATLIHNSHENTEQVVASFTATSSNV